MNPNRKSKPAPPISAAQRTVIMIICSQFNISKAQRADMLQDRYGKSSTNDLSSDQAGHFIKEFEAKGFVIKPKKQGLAVSDQGSGKSKAAPHSRFPASSRPPIPRAKGEKVIALASQEELDKVKALADLISWRAEDGLQLFLQKRMNIKDGKVRTAKDAYLAIEGLKKMFENGMVKQHGKAWWLIKFDNPAIQEYIQLHCPEEWR